MAWTRFWDMHSGGRQKLATALYFIEAPQAEAEVIFYNRFGRNPNRVTCTCCGEDYSINDYPTLDEATQYHRTPISQWNAANPQRQSLEEFEASGQATIIRAADIHGSEHEGTLPEEGYVWRD